MGLLGGTHQYWSPGGWDAVKRPVRVANMEAISVLNDEKPASKAAILNLPGKSVLGVDGTAGYTLPALSPPPPLPTPPWVPSWMKRTF